MGKSSKQEVEEVWKSFELLNEERYHDQYILITQQVSYFKLYYYTSHKQKQTVQSKYKAGLFYL
jgi:hypothetical protein